MGWHLEDWGKVTARPGQMPASEACCACGGGVHSNGTMVSAPQGTSAPAVVTAAPAATTAKPLAYSTAAPVAPVNGSETALMPRPTAAASVLAALRFTWNRCLCKKQWDGSMLPNSNLHGSCNNYCCNLDNDIIGDWCIVEDPTCEDQHRNIRWGYCRPRGQRTDSCQNLPSDWRDSQGNDCDSYQYMGWCTRQGSYGKNWKAEWGKFKDYQTGERTAIDACCGCGGGKTAPGAVSQCVDKAGWQDASGDTCIEYAEKAWCNSTGGYGPGWHADWGKFERYATQFSAPAACCACGGGSATGGMTQVPAAAFAPARSSSQATWRSSQPSRMPTLALLAFAVAAGAVLGGCCLKKRHAAQAAAAKQAASAGGGSGARIGSVQLGRKYHNLDGL